MNFNTSNDSFRKLFGNGLTYIVPPFQRDYSWDDEQWDDLWQDILELSTKDGESDHYMGYLVLQSSNSKEYSIIDGQQRLTTISLLILAALKGFEDLIAKGGDVKNNTSRRDILRNSYIGYLDPVSLHTRSKLNLNRHNDDFYQKYLVSLAPPATNRSLKPSEKLLLKGFRFFHKKVSEHCNTGEKIVALIDMLVDRLFFTVINVTDELNAYKVFETLNSRGVRLSATDLLKNYLFSILAENNKKNDDLKALEEKWEDILKALNGEGFSYFLRTYWNSHQPLVRKSNLFKTIRLNVTDREKAFSLLHRLDRAAMVYAALNDSRDSLWNNEQRNSIALLEKFSVTQPISLLMAAYQRFEATDPQVFMRVLRAIVVISFRYNVVCNRQVHEQERIYNNIANAISNENYTLSSEIIQDLRPLYPDDEEFRAAFTKKEFLTAKSTRNTSIVRYILFELEKQTSGQDYEVNSPKYNLEHILPQHPSEVWDDSFKPNQQDHYIYRLGNMALLESGLNRDGGNDGYQQKTSLLKQSCIQTTRAISENYGEWTPSNIDSRQKKMANIATAIWKLSF